MHDPLLWRFPLPRTHTGIPLGNGRLGALLWGEGNVLRITLGRADWWDHRGGKQWTDKMNFAAIRQLLKAGNEAGLREIFESTPPAAGQPPRPSLIPVGRIELMLPDDTQLREGRIDPLSGRITFMAEQHGQPIVFHAAMSPDRPLVLVQSPVPVNIRRVPAWEYIGEYLKSISFSPPQMIDDETMTGWMQTLPADRPLCVGCRQIDGALWIVADTSADTAADAPPATRRLLNEAVSAGPKPFFESTAHWWDNYWSSVPRIEVPNARLQFLYELGMYKFGAMTNPSGVAAGLQGPWIEEYRLPAWSGDYHFNINVQMCYSPAYAGNQLEHLRPLFEMIWSWKPLLAEHARLFAGVDDGLMLPHAVDDRCVNMGGFWTGTIDHGCTAWVAKMMFDYWLYGGDLRFLAERAYPFMLGAWKVYEAMLEETTTATSTRRFSLPVSVSPEYRGHRMNAWGRDASFQLAAIHWLLEALGRAAAALGITPNPRWAQVAASLPKACVHDQHILFWEGTDLEESHRHHSHLAGITPFDVIDPVDPAWADICQRSARRWIEKGMGLWTGWCMPWAASLHARFGHTDMAELALEMFGRVFMNEGHASLHNAAFPGFTLMVGANRNDELMQMDGAMGATAAILDMLLQARHGVHYLFGGCPARWKDVSFKGIRTEGGFLVDAERQGGRTQSFSIRATRSGLFRVRNPFVGPARIESTRGVVTKSRPLLELTMECSDHCTVTPA